MHTAHSKDKSTHTLLVSIPGRLQVITVCDHTYLLVWFVVLDVDLHGTMVIIMIGTSRYPY